MAKKPTVTIGIPAYNEEANIKKLLKILLKQRDEEYLLDKIYVISDGSTDKTVSEIKSIKSDKIYLELNTQRIGQSQTQNLIIKNTNSDILVLLNGDTAPTADDFVNQMVMPIKKIKNVGVVGAKVVSLEPINNFEKVLVYIGYIKNLIYEDIKGGNNIYLCHGRARAFSRKFYKKLKFPAAQAEDAFSYLRCKMLGYEFYYQPNAEVYFRNPTNLNDHLRQSTRFFLGKNTLSKYFPKKFVEKEYAIPKIKILKYIYIGVVKNPLISFVYAVILIMSKVLVKLNLGENNHLWNVSVSSKKL